MDRSVGEAVAPRDAMSMICACRRSSFSTCLEPAPVRSVTGSEEYKMDDTGTGTRLPRSTSVNVSRRALMRSAAATLAVTAVAGIARPAFAQRGPVRTLLKGGVVLSFDPAVGDFEKADVLLRTRGSWPCARISAPTQRQSTRRA